MAGTAEDLGSVVNYQWSVAIKRLSNEFSYLINTKATNVLGDRTGLLKINKEFSDKTHADLPPVSEPESFLVLGCCGASLA